MPDQAMDLSRFGERNGAGAAINERDVGAPTMAECEQQRALLGGGARPGGGQVSTAPVLIDHEGMR